MTQVPRTVTREILLVWEHFPLKDGVENKRIYYFYLDPISLQAMTETTFLSHSTFHTPLLGV